MMKTIYLEMNQQKAPRLVELSNFIRAQRAKCIIQLDGVTSKLLLKCPVFFSSSFTSCFFFFFFLLIFSIYLAAQLTPLYLCMKDKKTEFELLKV